MTSSLCTFVVGRRCGRLLAALRCVGAGASWLPQPTTTNTHTTRTTHTATHTIRTTRTATHLAQLRRMHSHTSSKTSEGQGALLGVPGLTSPAGFARLADEAIEASDRLVEDILSAPTSSAIIDRFDDISNVLCSVADMAEFVRNVHPNPVYVGAARDACMRLLPYFETLNTHVGLHAALSRLVDDPAKFGSLSEEGKRAGMLFMHDFEQSGITTPEAQRRGFVALSEQAVEYGMKFAGAQRSPRRIEVNPADLVSMDENHFGAVAHALSKNTDGRIFMQCDDIATHAVLSRAPSGSLRESVYRATHARDPAQLHLLESLLQTRRKLAAVSGFPSYAHKALRGTMAGHPDRVAEFLEKLSLRLRPFADAEVAAFARDKMTVEGDGAGPIRAWDRVFYEERGRVAAMRGVDERSLSLAMHFPLPAVIRGLGDLLGRLYSVRMVPQAIAEGEVWADGVTKYAVVNMENGALIGHLYLDLVERHGKIGTASHHTIRGARQSNGRRQTCIVAVVCSFRAGSGGAIVLGMSALETLLHEMGHAMHTMLGTTKYQHVAGTRCSFDFVETPSVLMEAFASDARILDMMRQSDGRDHVVRKEHVQALRRMGRVGAALDLQWQVVMAMADQRFYGLAHEHPEVTFADVVRAHSSIPLADGTAPFLHFGHVFGYGASYYSYSWSRALATLIWRRLFAADPTSNAAGLRFRKDVLCHGGARDPWAMIGDVLGTRPSVDDYVDVLVDSISPDSDCNR